MKSFVYLTFSLLSLVAALPLEDPGKEPKIVPEKYIVMLKPGVKASEVSEHMVWAEQIHKRSLDVEAFAVDSHKKGKGKGRGKKHRGVEKVWKGKVNGYSGEFDKKTITEIAENDDVLFVEPVQTVDLYGTVTQSSVTWGLGSISRRTPGSTKYLYDESAGNDTWAYIVDTGLYTEHKEFEGRAFLGYNAIKDSEFQDLQGHGTHCAGTIGSRAYGVAKKAKMISVKVFDEGASTTDVVIDGYQWAVTNITNTPGRAAKSVISMSIGGGFSRAFNTCIEKAYGDGILTVVAAGNSGADASKYSPAAAPNAITVGAIDKNNIRPTFSNYGPLVDVFAPGVGVRSTWIGSQGASAYMSGTSMACPHVAGLALYLMGLGNDTLSSPRAVTDRIKELATPDVVVNATIGTPNFLAYNGIV